MKLPKAYFLSYPLTTLGALGIAYGFLCNDLLESFKIILLSVVATGIGIMCFWHTLRHIRQPVLVTEEVRPQNLPKT